MRAKQSETNSNRIQQSLCLLFGILVTTSLSSAFGNEGHNQPIFNPRPRNVSFALGETATLPCSIRDLETKFVYWMRMSKPNPITVGEYVYSPDDRFSIQRIPELFEWNLKIKDVKKEDEDVYFCAVSAGEKREKYRQMVLLRVKASMYRVTKMENMGMSTIKETSSSEPAISISGTDFVTKGNPIKLQCNATGVEYVPEILDWFKDGNIVSRHYSGHVKITDFNLVEKKTLISKLYIRKSTMEDAGNYMCRSTNLDIGKIMVHVLDEEVSIIRRRQNTDPESLGGTDSSHGDAALKTSNKLCTLVLATLLVIFVS